MTIGYLHVGSATHGVTRYGAMLARAAREHLSDDVVEAEVVLRGSQVNDEQRLQAAVQHLSAADVVHLQYNERIWGDAHAAAHVRTALSACQAPFVVTLHDVRDGYGWKGVMQRTWSQRTVALPGLESKPGTDKTAPSRSGRASDLWTSMYRAGQYLWKEWQNTRATRHLVRRAARVLVCTTEEASRLQWVADDRLQVIPHFVEPRPIAISRTDAKKVLRLDGLRVCTVLGFIHRAKGHALVVDALPVWPSDVQVVFAGGPGDERFIEQLQQRAMQHGVAERLRVTGYLDEMMLDRYLAATDLALCPFKRVSASGSLSTWIAAERPILASEQPQIEEYNAIAPGAIVTFSPYTPEALAEAARAQLNRDAEAGRAARARLREKLSLPRVIQQHAAVYRTVACET